MNWRLILLLSTLGLAMGLGIVFFLPPSATPALWTLVIALSGYAIAKRCAHRRFLHGLLVGIFDWLLNAGTHLLFFHNYAVRHAGVIGLVQQLAPRMSVLQLMAATAPAVAVGVGIVVGLVAMVFGALVGRGARPAAG